MPVLIHAPEDATSKTNKGTGKLNTARPAKSRIYLLAAALAVLACSLIFLFSRGEKPSGIDNNLKITNPTVKGNSEGYAPNGQLLTPGSRPANARDSSRTYN